MEARRTEVKEIFQGNLHRHNYNNEYSGNHDDKSSELIFFVHNACIRKLKKNHYQHFLCIVNFEFEIFS